MVQLVRPWTLRTLAAGLFLGFVVAPLLALAFFNHPSAADDYCFAYMTRDYGFWRAQKYYYDGWTGRYFANFLFHATPLFPGDTLFAKLLPVGLLVGLGASLYGLVGQLIRSSVRDKLTLTAVFLALYLIRVGSLAEALYWSASAYVYTLPQILLLGWVTVLIRHRRARRGLNRGLLAVLAGFLVFALIGSSELFLLLTVWLLGGFIGYAVVFSRRSWKHRVPALLLGLVVVAAGSCYLELSAPGNSVRLGGNPLSGNIPYSLRMSFQSIFRYGSQWLTTTLLCTPLFLSWLGPYLPNRQAMSRYFRVPPWVALVAWTIAQMLLFFPQYYGIGIEPPVRVLNVVYFFFLLGWFYNLTVLSVWAYERHRLRLTRHLPDWAIAGLAVLVGFVAYRSETVRLAYRDLRTGTAQRYDRELDARYAQIRTSPADTVYVAPLTAIPQSLFTEDIRNTPEHLWNACYAKHFQKRAIVLKPKP
jgi:hypothetical protein